MRPVFLVFAALSLVGCCCDRDRAECAASTRDPQNPSAIDGGARAAGPAPATLGATASLPPRASDPGTTFDVSRLAAVQHAAAREAGVPVAFENALGMRFVLIPAGTFEMGSPETEPDRESDESLHAVTLTRPYYLQTTEVTNAQFRAFRAAHRSYEQTPGQSLDGDDQPAGGVSWTDAQDFVAWLNAREPGRGYRLPTEAEWERACRAGTTTPYWWGPSVTEAQREAMGAWRKDSDRQLTTKVGTQPANPWGLHEVHGNVREWVSDVYTDQPYPPGSATDPTGAALPADLPIDRRSHIARGGGFADNANMMRSAFRAGLQGDDETRAYVGLRVAASVPSASPR